MFNYEFYFFPLKYETWLVLNIQCSNLKAIIYFNVIKLRCVVLKNMNSLFVEILCETL